LQNGRQLQVYEMKEKWEIDQKKLKRKALKILKIFRNIFKY